MSKVATRFPLAQAMPWAQAAANACADLSSAVHIAGSIRRQRDEVGDIDLVVLDDGENPWLRQQIGMRLAVEGYRQTKDGEHIATFTREGTPSLDLYYATPDTWGITMLVRTGSAAHNIKLTQVARRMLPVRQLKVSRGIVDTADRVIASRTEEEIFAALGTPFVRPEDREAPEYESWIREDGE